MFKSIGFGVGVVLLVLGLAAIVLAVSKPTPPDHYVVIEGQLFPAMREAVTPSSKTEGTNGLDRFKDTLGHAVVRIAVERAIKGARERMQYHNYILFSTVTLDGRIVTLGVLGHVRLMVDAH